MPNKANTPAKAATPATPAKADKAADRLALAERITSERALAAKLFAAAETGAISIPVKSLAAFKRTYKRDVAAHAIGRKPSPRQAAALAVAALANGAKLADGATFSRKFDRNGAAFAIENGALSDAIASGLCTYDGKAEQITLCNAAEIASQIGAITLPK
jgi:hypothetical protein